MIPNRKETKPVILDFMNDRKKHSSDQLQEMIATHFALTREERQRKRGKGPHPIYVNETAWALVELQEAGLIKKLSADSSIRVLASVGFDYRITNSGQDAASKQLLGTPIRPRAPRREPLEPRDG